MSSGICYTFVMIGLICMSNNSGLGNQTRRLAELIQPDRLLAIDSSGFSKNTKQHWQWYDGFNGILCQGFPSKRAVDEFLKGLRYVFCAENPFSFYLLSAAKRKGIKVYIQSNYEFCDHLNKPDIELPYRFLMPSHWKIAEMNARFPGCVEYLPPPIHPGEFKDARDRNMLKAHGHDFLHIVGTLAAHDRNGTLTLLEAVSRSKADFTLTIRSQHELPPEYFSDDRRIRYVIEDVEDVQSMYSGYDALIVPRRYGGLCLTCNEALMSGLPVIMTNISPNNKLLPSEWLVPAKQVSTFMARVPIEVYEADVQALASKIDWLAEQDCEKIKVQAFELGYENFAFSQLQDKYKSLLI